MSPPTSSSSSSKSQRRPLHDRTNSDNNKLAIRIVPYSPPRLSQGESEASSSYGSSSGVGAESSNYDYHTTSSDQGSSSPTIREGRKGSLPSIVGAGSASPSPTFSTASLARAKGKGVSGAKLGSDLSGAPTPLHPVNKKASYGSNNSRLIPPPSDTSDYGDPSTPTQKFVRPKADRFINVHEDKTFSIVLKPTGIRQPRDQGSSSQAASFKSPPLSYASTLSSAHERISFDTTTVDHPSSPPSSVADLNPSPYTPYTPGSAACTPGPTTFNDRIEEEVDPITSSPNYRMIGGLRKVRKTDSFRQDHDDEEEEEEEEEDEEDDLTQPQLPPLPEVPSSPPQLPSPLAEKPSFSSVSSGQTDSSLEEPSNFEILGRSSPPLQSTPPLRSSPPLPYSETFEESPSSGDANYQILGESSPSQPFVSSPAPAFLGTPASQNYVVHGSQSSPASAGSPSRQPRPKTSDDSLVLREKYSQESLIVPPLIPRKKASRERFGYHKQKSSRSLRRANSFSSLSSIITEGSASIFFAQTANIIRLGAAPPVTSIHPPQRAKQQHHSWAGSSNLIAQRPLMEAHPHQWSSQLSTVASEDEESSRASRALSSPSGPDYRLSHGSRHSRQMLSISSSLAYAEEPPMGSSRSNLSSASGLDSHGSLTSPGIASPSSAYMRGGPQAIRVVRDVDEDGDGITDLHNLMHKNSSRLLSQKSSDRDLYSSSSSGRPNSRNSRTGSFTSTLPVWAKVYYGSGERRWLAGAPSMRSYSDDSRPGSAIPSGSPSVDPFPPNVFSPRRRPRELQPNDGRPESVEVEQMGPSDSSGFLPLPRRLRKMSSSIWSPHLQMDRRASRFSMWAPPSTTWSKDKGKLGRRNLQIVMFALGWIFPFAWMTAAVLPLPHKPLPQMTMANHHSTAELGGPIETPDIFSGRVDPAEDSNYQSARWWRNVNRLMCIVGLLIIGAIVALVIVGIRQKW